LTVVKKEKKDRPSSACGSAPRPSVVPHGHFFTTGCSQSPGTKFRSHVKKLAHNNQTKVPELDGRSALIGTRRPPGCSAWTSSQPGSGRTTEALARWTLILDDALRRAAVNHPLTTNAGLRNQVLHQSRLKHALVCVECLF